MRRNMSEKLGLYKYLLPGSVFHPKEIFDSIAINYMCLFIAFQILLFCQKSKYLYNRNINSYSQGF